MHQFRPTKPMIRICRIVGRNGCIALHYYVHFLRISSFVTRGIESEGIGARSIQCTTPIVYCPTRSRKHGNQIQGHIYVWSFWKSLFYPFILTSIKCKLSSSQITSEAANAKLSQNYLSRWLERITVIFHYLWNLQIWSEKSNFARNPLIFLVESDSRWI